MAMKFTEAADTGLITAATRAGLATTPADYSKAFQTAADSYQKTMEASSKAWGDLGTIIGVVGAEIQKNAADWNSTIDKIYDAGGTDKLVDDIYSVRDEIRDLGPLGGILGNREKQKDRRKLIAKKNKIFSEVDGWGNILDVASKAAETETLDYDLMGLEDEEMFGAIIASNTSNKLVSSPLSGSLVSAKVSRDEKTNQLMYTLYKEDRRVATDINGNPRTMSLPEFKALVKDNAIDSEGVYAKNWGTFKSNWEKAGQNYGGELSEYHQNQALTDIKNMTKTPENLKRSMRTEIGGTSFYDEITSGSVLSADIWTLMQGNLPTIETDKGTELAKEGALANIPDTDKSGGISQDEINKNYLEFTGAMLGGNHGAEVFRSWALEKTVRAPYQFGAKYHKTDTDDSTKNPFGTKSLNMGGGDWLSASDRWERRKIIEAGKGGFTGVYGDYAPSKDGWTRDQGDGPQPIGLYQMMQDEQLLIAGDVDPSIKEKEQKLKTMNYLPENITAKIGALTDDKAIMEALNDLDFDNFKFDYTYSGNNIKVKFKDGNWKKFVVSGTLPQQLTAWMNMMNPKVGYVMNKKDGGKAKWDGTNWVTI